MTGFTAIPGPGVEARVDGRQVIFGILKLMSDRQVLLGDLETKYNESLVWPKA